MFLLPWLLTAAILVGTAGYALWPNVPELRNPTRPGEDGALIWGDAVFANALELEAWLRARGVSYREWAKKHPAAVKLIAPSPADEAAALEAEQRAAAAAKAAAKPKPTAKPAAKPAVTSEAGPLPADGEPAPGVLSDVDARWGIVALLALLVPLGAAASSRLSGLGLPAPPVGFRLGLALSGVSVGIGLAAASLLS